MKDFQIKVTIVQSEYNLTKLNIFKLLIFSFIDREYYETQVKNIIRLQTTKYTKSVK